MKGSSYLSCSLRENCLSHRRKIRSCLYFIIISDVQLHKIITTRNDCFRVFEMNASVSREAFRHLSIVHYWISMNEGGQLAPVATVARNRLCKKDEKDVRKEAARLRCRGSISHPHERERENAGSFPTFRCEWKCLRHAHTRARGNPRSVTNAFSFREPRSSRFRFNLTCASFSHTERIRALQKTIVAFCFYASDTQSKVTWVFYTQIVISLLACFDDKVIA